MLSGIKEYINWNSFILYGVVSLVGYYTGLVGALLLCGFFLLFFINKGYYLHLVVFFILTFFFADLISGKTDFFDVLRYVVLGVGLFLTLLHTKISENKGWLLFPFSFLALIFSLTLSPQAFDASIRAIAYLFIAFVVFGFLKMLFTQYPLRFSVTLLILIGLYYTVPLILNFLPFSDLVRMGSRYSGFMGNPNGVGLLSIMCIPLVDYLYLVIKRTGGLEVNPKLLIWTKGVIIFSVLLASSRNALFSIVIYEALKLGFRNFSTSVLMIFLILTGYTFVYSIDWINIIYGLGLGDYFRVESLENASGRTDVWEIVWEEIKISPFIGKGILYDNYFMEQYRSQMLGVIPRAYYGVWNSYLSLWMNVGVFGLLAYFYFIFRIYLQSSVKRLATPFLAAALFSGIAESWMASSLNAFTPLFFLYFALQSVPLEELEYQES